MGQQHALRGSIKYILVALFVQPKMALKISQPWPFDLFSGLQQSKCHTFPWTLNEPGPSPEASSASAPSRWLKAFSWNEPTDLLKRPAPIRSKKLVMTIKNTVKAVIVTRQKMKAFNNSR